jgi:uroporphyrinogen-III synthase
MRLAVLRPADRLEEAVDAARAMGFEPVAASPLAIEVNDGPAVDELVAELRAGRVDDVVMTSSTAVDSLVIMLRSRGEEAAALLAPCTLVAIGPATAAAMRSAGLAADLLPDEYTSAGLVSLLSRRGACGRRVALLRSDHGDEVLSVGLEEAGAEVTEIAVYRLVPRLEDGALLALAEEALAGRIDAFAFTSALTASTFVAAASRLAPREEVIAMLNARAVSAIGPPTRKRLEGMGFRVRVVPERATYEAMLEALSAFASSGKE